MRPDRENHDLRLGRARFCYEEVAGWSRHCRPEATAWVQGLPIQVRSQGLLITVALLAGDKSETGASLADTLARWLLARAPHRPLGQRENPTADELLAALAGASRTEHAAVQREALLLLDQIKIFAKALAGGDGAR